MPSHSAANPEIKQLYIDGHFCYAYKVGIVTNGLGIFRHIDFTIKPSLKNTLKLPLIRNPILPMRINPSMMQGF